MAELRWGARRCCARAVRAAGEAGTTHLRLLSKAAVMLMDAGFRDKVRASTDPVEIAELINSGLED